MRIHALPAPQLSKERGSALLLTLVFTGILAIAIGAMLSSVRHLARATSQKIAYEEAYDAALGGLAAAKGWVMDPTVAGRQLASTNSNYGARFTGITSGSISLSQMVKGTDVRHQELIDALTAEQVAAYYSVQDSALGNGSYIDGNSRKVLFTFTAADQRLIKLRSTGKSNASLFGNSGGNVTSYVRSIRVTTPYRRTAAIPPDNLRRVSLILEAEAVALSQGREIVRRVQQKVLIVPGTDDERAPVVAPVPGVAFGGAGITIKGASSLNIKWAPVWAKGNVELLELTLSAADSSGKRKLQAGNGNSKFYGAGIRNDNAVDKWLRYQVGGLLTTTGGTPIFPTGVRDFFYETRQPGGAAGLTAANLVLDGSYDTPYKENWVGNGLNVLYGEMSVSGTQTDTSGTGAFVQNAPEMVAKIDDMIQKDLDYESWKMFAIANNGYVRPVRNGSNKVYYVNKEGLRLYVAADKTLSTDPSKGTALTTINDLSMATRIPSDFNTNTIPDQILFVDTFDGTNNVSNANNIRTTSLSSSFFWKGLMYINGNVAVGSTGSNQKVWVKDPDEFDKDPTGKSTGSLRSSVYLDGVVYARGEYDRGSNGIAYGSVICAGTFNGNGNPDILYNSRNKYGLFRDPPKAGGLLTLKAMISGPIREL